LARDASAFSRHELRRPRGEHKQKGSGGMIGPPEPGTSRYVVGLAIPHPVARLQSRTPLRQANKYTLSRSSGGRARGIRGERRFRRAGDWSGRPDPGAWCASAPPRKRRSSRYQASTDRQWAKTDSGASAARPTRIEGRRRPSAPASRRPASEAASRQRDEKRSLQGGRAKKAIPRSKESGHQGRRAGCARTDRKKEKDNLHLAPRAS
jgi:hypothetical protein